VRIIITIFDGIQVFSIGIGLPHGGAYGQVAVLYISRTRIHGDDVLLSEKAPRREQTLHDVKAVLVQAATRLLPAQSGKIPGRITLCNGGVGMYNGVEIWPVQEGALDHFEAARMCNIIRIDKGNNVGALSLADSRGEIAIPPSILADLTEKDMDWREQRDPLDPLTDLILHRGRRARKRKNNEVWLADLIPYRG